MLKALYVIAIGLLFAAFIGFGVNTFYPMPKSPDCLETKMVPPSAEEKPVRDTDACTKNYEAFNAQQKDYSRNTSIIYLVLSIVVIAISLFGLGKIDVIGDGITLGGVFILFVSIVSAFGSASEIFRFVGVTIGLAIILFLSYWKFVRPTNKAPL